MQPCRSREKAGLGRHCVCRNGLRTTSFPASYPPAGPGIFGAGKPRPLATTGIVCVGSTPTGDVMRLLSMVSNANSMHQPANVLMYCNNVSCRIQDWRRERIAAVRRTTLQVAKLGQLTKLLIRSVFAFGSAKAILLGLTDGQRWAPSLAQTMVVPMAPGYCQLGFCY